MNATTIATTKTVTTLAEKLEKAKALVAKYEAQIAAGGTSKVVKLYTAGEVVTFNYGRGEGKKEHTGTVLAQGKLGNGTAVVKIMSGEGIEAQLFQVPVGDVITEPTSAPQAAPVEAQAAPVVATEVPASGQPVDPYETLNVDELLSQ